MKNKIRNLPKIIMQDLAEEALKSNIFGLQKNCKIGEFYQRLDINKRSILKDLKSDDINDVIWPPIYVDTNCSYR